MAQSGFWTELPPQLRLKLVKDRFYREIQAIHLFRNSDLAFVSQLIVHSKPYHILAGQVIYDIGDMAEEISFVLQGSVRITVPGFKDVLVGCGTVGGFFGELEFFKTSTRTARYAAVHDCLLLGIDFHRFTTAIEDHPDAGARFLLKIERRYNLFQAVRKAPFSLTRNIGECKTADTKGLIAADPRHSPATSCPPPPISTPVSASVPVSISTSVSVSSASVRRSSQRKTSASLRLGPLTPAADAFNKFVKMDGKEGTVSAVHDFVVGDKLWNDGEIVEAQNMDDVQASLFSKTTSTIRYRVLLVDGDKKEITREMTVSFLRGLGFIHPRDARKYKWDTFMGLLIIYSVLIIPVQLAFSSYLASQIQSASNSVDFLIDSLFFMDIVFNFNLVYFSDADAAFVAVRWRIMQHYLRSWFLVDFLSFFPFSEFITAIIGSDDISPSNLTTIQLVKAVRLIRLLKIFQAVDMSKVLRRLEDNFNVNPNILSLMLTILQVLFISHMMCCMWWGLCTVLSEYAWYDDESMVYDVLRYASFQDQYIASLYWTITTLSTTGYGDIVPSNDKERILCIFIMVVGASVFGYVIANVAALVTGSSLMEVLATQRVNIVKEFLKDCKCNSHLTSEIVNHFKQANKVHYSIDENVAYARLPTSIRNDLLINANKVVIDRIPLFRHIKNTSVKLYLLSQMTLKVGAAGRCLIKDGKSGCEIFFLVEGDAAIYHMIESSTSSPIPAAAAAAALKGQSNQATLSVARKKERRGPEFISSFGVNLNLRHLQRRSVKSGVEETKAEGLHTSVIDKHDDIANKPTITPNPIPNPNPAPSTVPNPSSDLNSDTGPNPGLGPVVSKKSPSVGVSDVSRRGRRRSLYHQMNTKKRLRAQFNWERVKRLLPSIADMGKRMREDEKQANAKLLLIGTLQVGDFIGHREIMRGEKHAYTVLASTPCKYYTLHRSTVTKLLSEHPDIALELQTALGYCIYDDSQATAERASRKGKKLFLKRLREQSVIAKLNALKAKTATPKAITNTVRLLLKVSKNLMGTKKIKEGSKEQEEKQKMAPRQKKEHSQDESLGKGVKTTTLGSTSLSDLFLCGTQLDATSDIPFNKNLATLDASDASYQSRNHILTGLNDPQHGHLSSFTLRKCWSASNVLDAPQGDIGPELFLVQNSSEKGSDPSMYKIQRRLSFPSDKSQYHPSLRFKKLDDIDYATTHRKYSGYGSKQ